MSTGGSGFGTVDAVHSSPKTDTLQLQSHLTCTLVQRVNCRVYTADLLCSTPSRRGCFGVRIMLTTRGSGHPMGGFYTRNGSMASSEEQGMYETRHSIAQVQRLNRAREVILVTLVSCNPVNTGSRSQRATESQRGHTQCEPVTGSRAH